jgi:ubiquinone/menaquinone biosynthesis C-methylase UbiE
MPQLTPALLSKLKQNGPTDPIAYYRRPLIGWLFRERINMGLRLLPQRRFRHALEVGYGAGAVLVACGDAVESLSGIDLDADPAPVHALLASRGQRASLTQGSVYELPYADRSFDLVVSFSVFEHLHEYERALREVARVLEPGGLFLLGMPAVNKVMELGFRAIGFKGIDDHHVTTPTTIAATFAKTGFGLRDKRILGVPALSLYFTWLLERSAP